MSVFNAVLEELKSEFDIKPPPRKYSNLHSFIIVVLILGCGNATLNYMRIFWIKNCMVGDMKMDQKEMVSENMSIPQFIWSHDLSSCTDFRQNLVKIAPL